MKLEDIKNYFKKKEEVKEESYQMKDTYNSNSLVVARLEYLSSEYDDFGPMFEKTEQKYIFELVSDGKEIKYREIFMGYVFDDEGRYFDLPYVVNPLPFNHYFPEMENTDIPKLSFLLLLNDINYPKSKQKIIK